MANPLFATDELETTEPDFWLNDFIPESEAESRIARAEGAFFEAKTEPARLVLDAVGTSVPDEEPPEPSQKREEALRSLLQTLRSVLNDETQSPASR